MKMLIPGATGCTGMQRLREAINRGHEVYVPVRDASRVKIQSTTLTLFVGNPGNRVSLSRALYGCDAVLSALNISRTSDFPWSPL